MPINPDHLVSIMGESEGRSRAARKAASAERKQAAGDKEVLDVSRRLIAENRKAYERLAR